MSFEIHLQRVNKGAGEGEKLIKKPTEKRRIHSYRSCKAIKVKDIYMKKLLYKGIRKTQLEVKVCIFKVENIIVNQIDQCERNAY